MEAVALLVVVALVSLLITRIATVVLTVTGMPRPAARFQARLVSGVGSTTSESEFVVSHPVRRRVVMALMLVGNVGLATAVAGMLGGFARADAGESATRLFLLMAGLAAVYALSRSAVVDRHLTRLIGRILTNYTQLDVTDVGRLLHLSGPYSVGEVAVEEGAWLSGGSFKELALRDEGIVVLGVARKGGSYLGVPEAATVAAPGDTLIVYGRDEAVAQLAARSVGQQGRREHEAAVAAHRAAAEAERGDDHARPGRDREP